MAILIPGVGSVEISGYVPGIGIVYAGAEEGGVTGASGTVTGALVEAFALDSEALFGVHITPTSSMTFSLSATGQPFWKMLEGITLDDNLTISIEMIVDLVETIGLRETLIYVAKILLSQGFTLADTSTAEVLRLLALSEMLAVSSSAAASLDVVRIMRSSLSSTPRPPTIVGTVRSGDKELERPFCRIVTLDRTPGLARSTSTCCPSAAPRWPRSPGCCGRSATESRASTPRSTRR